VKPNAEDFVPGEIPVSVIIPAYNAERFIAQTLTMLDHQTVRAAEIIVVDDGSTDATAAIAETFRARVIRGRHAGRAAARNAGIAMATHDWIALLDADDIWDPNKLEAQWSLHLEQKTLDIIATDYDRIDPEGTVLRPNVVTSQHQYWTIASQRLSGSAALLSPRLLARSLPEWEIFLPSTLLIRRSLFTRFGDFDLNVELEDAELFLRFLKNCRAAMIERPLLGYIQHPASVTANRSYTNSMAELARHVRKHSGRYHSASVRALRDLLPTLLLRLAKAYAQEKHYADTVGAVLGALASASSLETVSAYTLRAAAKHPIARTCFLCIPWTRETISLIPKWMSTPPPREKTDWPAIITDSRTVPITDGTDSVSMTVGK